MNRRRAGLVLAVVVTAGLLGCSADHGPDGQREPAAAMAVAPYLYSWGTPPEVGEVMRATGVTWFTLAHILSADDCRPAWDGTRPLTGGRDEELIEEVRAAGGDVVVSFGGWSGDKLGPACETAEELADAYQQVIDAYGLAAIDIDIENDDEFEDAEVQDRILTALSILRQRDADLVIIVTIPSGPAGPTPTGERLIRRAAEVGAGIDVFSIMPFNLDADDIAQLTIDAAGGLRDVLSSTFGWDDATAYRHMGISGMNGVSDSDELTSPETWTRVRDWAAQRDLARLSFWAVNRDRPCPDGGVQPNCSGIDQSEWEFTRITAGYHPQQP